MSAEQNGERTRRFLDELVNRQNTAVIDEMMSNDVVRHRPPGERTTIGRKRYHDDAAAMSDVFSEIEMEIDDLIAEADRVVVRWTYHAHHTGPMGDIAPSGKRVTFTGVNIFRFEDRLIVEDWEYTDAIGFIQQIGANPWSSQLP